MEFSDHVTFTWPTLLCFLISYLLWGLSLTVALKMPHINKYWWHCCALLLFTLANAVPFAIPEWTLHSDLLKLQIQACTLITLVNLPFIWIGRIRGRIYQRELAHYKELFPEHFKDRDSLD